MVVSLLETRMTTFIKTKFGIAIEFPSQRVLWSSESFGVKYNIRFGIPIEFLSQRRKKIIQIGPETSKLWFI